jgi:uncharacterized FlgJ-related protein
MNTINNIAYRVYNLLQSNGFDPITAKIITAQAAHETSNFSSQVYIENNNLFGLRRAAPYKTTSKGLKNSYSNYESIEDSIKDFAIYYKEFSYPKVFLSVVSYVEAIKAKRYFEADIKEYTRGVSHFYKLYFA